MQTLSAIPTRKAPSHPTPVEIWQQLLTYLLKDITAFRLATRNFPMRRLLRNILTPVSHCQMHSIFSLKNLNWCGLIVPVSPLSISPLLSG